MTHPYHLQHPLTLFYRNPETGITTNIIPDFNPPGQPDSYEWEFHQESESPNQGESAFVDTVNTSESDIMFDKCTWCGKDFKGDWFYRCLICSFCLDIPCAETTPPFTVANPKTHPHALLFLPRPLLVPCDGCGLVDALEPSYTCFQCNYMVHLSCIDLPRVIKITRHPHRLSYVPYHSPMRLSCQICYKEVDIKYGQYTCNHEGCPYVAHSKCATHPNVWDGTDLEWETEESEENEDTSPFVDLGDGLIQHFCHIHPLKLTKHDGVGDTEKQCRACVYPLTTHQFYHCQTCDYSLHEVCAGLSRKLDHALHNHTLTLNPWTGDTGCSVCLRVSTGFSYICSKEDCYDGVSRVCLDVQCISVKEYFIHKSHEHPIFISTSHNPKDEILCKRCKKGCLKSHLQCTLCDFALCYSCGVIPEEIHYRFDKHLLTLCCGESTDDGMYWCEVCEKELDPKEWFYTCNKCCTTVHLECIFGPSYCMRPGVILKGRRGVGTVVRNRRSTRLSFCHGCGECCNGYIYYEGRRQGHFDGAVFCSPDCVYPAITKRYYTPPRFDTR